MNFPCPVCASSIKAPDEVAGEKARCPTCHSKFIVPLTEGGDFEILEMGQPPSGTATKLIVPEAGPKRTIVTGAQARGGKGQPMRVVRRNKSPQSIARQPSAPVVKGPGTPSSSAPAVPVAPSPDSILRHPAKAAPAEPATPSAPTKQEVPAPPEPKPAQPKRPADSHDPDTATTSTVPQASGTESAMISTRANESAPAATNRLLVTKGAGSTAAASTSGSSAASAAAARQARLKASVATKKSSGSLGIILGVTAAILVALVAVAVNMSDDDGERKPAADSGEDAEAKAAAAALAAERKKKEEAEAAAEEARRAKLLADFGKIDESALTERPAGPRVTEDGYIHYENVIKPLLKRYCVRCHDAVNEEGGLDLTHFESEALALKNPDIWETASDLVEMGQMPPKFRKAQPTEEEKETLYTWIDSVSRRWDEGKLGRDPGRTTIRRLNKNEYNYTVSELLGLKIRPASNFPEDGGGEAGFDNNADALFLPSLLMENYVEAAGFLVKAVYANTAAKQKYLIAHPVQQTPEEAAKKIIRNFATRAYRRPVETDEVFKLYSIFESQVKKKKDFRTAMQMPLLAVLISPNFLYRSEYVRPGSEGKGVYKVDDYELASRLSYFIWSSMPDDTLFDLAAKRKLHDPEVLEAQVIRMLEDPRSRSLSMHFAGQWFKWEDLRSTTNPDKDKFPTFTFPLRVAMYRESSIFFENLVKENGSILDLVDSDYTYLNPQLAQHYGIAGVSGPGFRKVALTDRNRGGVLGMGSVLAATSLPLRTSPSIRGNYVLTEILGTPPPPPPMDVPQLPEDDRAIKAETFRDELAQHRDDSACRGCHARIDPLGFGLQNFDSLGRWRTKQNGKPVDSGGVLEDGTEFSSPAELKQILMERRNLFTRNMVEKALSFALGRELSPYDRQVVHDVTQKVIAADYRIHTLFLEIARSYPFLHCRGDDYTP